MWFIVKIGLLFVWVQSTFRCLFPIALAFPIFCTLGNGYLTFFKCQTYFYYRSHATGFSYYLSLLSTWNSLSLYPFLCSVLSSHFIHSFTHTHSELEIHFQMILFHAIYRHWIFGSQVPIYSNDFHLKLSRKHFWTAQHHWWCSNMKC